MFLLVIVLVVCFFVWGFRIHASTKDIREATRNIPGPYNIPLLGTLGIAMSLSPKNVLTKSEEISQQYGNIMRGWILNRLYVATGDTELNEQILTCPTHITKMSAYGILQQWLGVGLLLSDGRKWHSRRKIITPTFHFKVLEQFLEIFDCQSTSLIDCLAERADGMTAFDISPYICSATLDIIAESAMGTRVNAQTDKNMPYTRAVNEMSELVTWRFIRVHLNSEIVFTLLNPHKKWRQMKLIRILHDFTKKVIEERRQVLENHMNSGHNISEDDQDDIGIRKRMALLNVLLQSTIDGKPLSDEDIREEVDTFMFEGHDTTTSALSFTLHLLARHPQIQNKVLAEIRKVYGDDVKKPLTLMNLNELKYLESVIRESLRLYPPVPYIGREITENFHYKHSKLGDGVMPAGTQIVLAIYNSLRDPRYYENPSKFIPERHENNEASGGVYAFIPFSAGPRNCIGQKFAMYEMKVILLKIIRSYELLPLGEAVEPILSIVLRSDTGMQLGLRKRTT